MVKNLKFGLPDGRVWATLERFWGWRHSPELDGAGHQWVPLALPLSWIWGDHSRYPPSRWQFSLQLKSVVSNRAYSVTGQIWIPAKKISQPGQFHLPWTDPLMLFRSWVLWCRVIVGSAYTFPGRYGKFLGKLVFILLRSCLFFLLIWMLFDFLFSFLLTLI